VLTALSKRMAPAATGAAASPKRMASADTGSAASNIMTGRVAAMVSVLSPK
jgi:hypothetical protein